jgi:hypothetical protein
MREVGMADQLSGLYVATLILVLFGIAVFVNALLTHGLHWTGRRLADFWRAHVHVGHRALPDGPAGRKPASPVR